MTHLIRTELAIVGAGPAGVCAALEAASYGVKVTLIDREQWIGGQFVKQTHKFSDGTKKRRHPRGRDCQRSAVKVKANPDIRFMGSTEVLGYYQAEMCCSLRLLKASRPLKPERLLVATGASEKMILFPGNDPAWSVREQVRCRPS